jgi:hypothetical protein
VKRRHKACKFRYSSEVAEAKRSRRRLERKFHRSGLSIDKEILIDQNKRVAKLVKIAKGNYISTLINNCPRALFQVFSEFTTDTRSLLPTQLSDPPNAFAIFFSEKVASIVNAFPIPDTVHENPVHSFSDFEFNSFRCVTTDDIVRIKIKCSSIDPLPTNFMKEVFPTLYPVVLDLINTSLSTGGFPSVLKEATLVPIIKNKKVDINQLKNYRPVSLLSFISKILERTVVDQLTEYIETHELGNSRQSAYKASHSVETTLLALQSELLHVLNEGKAAFLILLDLSAAFDTVNHQMLLNILNSAYHITGTALQWFKSYLANRSFKVKIGNIYSKSYPLPTGVPQGSVLGPILFNIFSSGLASIFTEENVSAYFYADDTQFYVTFDPNCPESENKARALIQHLFTKLILWMDKHHLKLNTDKTVFLPISRDKVRTFDPLLVGSYSVEPSHKVRNLGFIFNRSLTITDHVSYIRQSTFYHFR